jgi:hypothetical protein
MTPADAGEADAVGVKAGMVFGQIDQTKYLTVVFGTSSSVALRFAGVKPQRTAPQ